MNRSILFLLALGCTFSLYAANADITTKIDSVYGATEVRRAGSQKWETIGTGAKLFNNDIIRVLNNSMVRLLSFDGNTVYIHANSQLLINNFENADKQSVSEHFTVFFGAAYFLINAALPPGMQFHDVKVFTPTSVSATRGTSFEVEVAENTGSTIVRVVNHTVLVRNIIKNVSIFLKAGLQSTIEINTDPILPRPFLEKDLAALKSWVGEGIIQREMNTQLSSASRDRDIISGKIESRLAIAPFKNLSQYTGTWKIDSVFARSLANQVSSSVPGLKAIIGDSSVSDPLAFGVAHGARFVITGVIENFDITQHAKISARADEYKEYNTSIVKIRIQLTDVESGKLLNDNAFSGEFTDAQTPQNSWKEISKLPCSLADKKFVGSILGKSMKLALESATEEMVRYIRAQ